MAEYFENGKCTNVCFEASVSSATRLLNIAQSYADAYTGCCKTAVGSLIVDSLLAPTVMIPGANFSIPHSCKTHGCLRKEKYGEDSKSHRAPEDCRAIHSELSAIIAANSNGVSVKGKTIIVTRYPCEACARAIVQAGISRVVYGRAYEISEETHKIFEMADVEVLHISEWGKDINDTNI